MFPKEFKETLRQTVFIMAFFTLVPVLYLLDQSIYSTGLTFIEYMSNGLDLFLLITAVYLAYNMFKTEERDGATEYLLSLPINRWQLIRYKMIPRITVLTILLLTGFILNDLRIADGSVLGSIFIHWGTGLLVLIGLITFIQVCGLILGLTGCKSWSVRLMLLIMVLCVWQLGTITIVISTLIYKIFDIRAAFRFSFWLGTYGRAILDFSVFFALLWYILKPLYRKWDLTPMRVREIWFQKRAILPMLVFLLLFLNQFLAISYIPFITYS